MSIVSTLLFNKEATQPSRLQRIFRDAHHSMNGVTHSIMVVLAFSFVLCASASLREIGLPMDEYAEY